MILAGLTGILMVIAIVLLVQRERRIRADEELERHSGRGPERQRE
jgi:hypothetical protein